MEGTMFGVAGYCLLYDDGLRWNLRLEPRNNPLEGELPYKLSVYSGNTKVAQYSNGKYRGYLAYADESMLPANVCAVAHGILKDLKDGVLTPEKIYRNHVRNMKPKKRPRYHNRYR